MLLYNTTFGVDNAVTEPFIEWLKTEFIPNAADADGEYLHDAELFSLPASVGGEGVSSYALHLRADDDATLARWYEDHGSRLFDYIMQHWNGRVVFFSTTLKSLE